MKLTKKRAKELCIKKWEYIVKMGGKYNFIELEEAIPQLIGFRFFCAYCELYFFKSNKQLHYCAKCPLVIITHDYNFDEGGCCQKNHPYELWQKNPSKETAQAVLDLILKS
jgi:hypothetical protein